VLKLKRYTYLLLSISGIFLVIGILSSYGILNTVITPSGTNVLSMPLLMMSVQIDKTTTEKRKKSFWILQALFHLCLVIFLIAELTVYRRLLLDLLLTIAMFVVVIKTGHIEKRNTTLSDSLTSHENKV